MQNFITSLLTTSVTMSVLALIYMATTPLLAKRYSEKWRYYAWLVIVIGLIIPLRPQFDNAVITVSVPAEAAHAINMGNIAVADIHSPHDSTAPVAAVAPLENTVPASSLPGVQWWQIGFAAWLAGMVLFLTYHIARHYRFVKMVTRWSESVADEHTLEVLQSLKAEMEISARICLYRCSSVCTPVMTGFVRPRMLLPGTDFAQDELRFILKHELVHYKRKDLYYKGFNLCQVFSESYFV